MISARNVFLCAGLRAAMAYREEIRAVGLNLEVQQFVSARQFSMDYRSEVSRLKLLKDKLGLRYAFHAPFMQLNFFSRSAERARMSYRTMLLSLDVAAELAAEFVVVHSLFIPRRHNTDYGADWAVRAPKFFREVAREAAARGLTLAIENMLEKGPESLLWLIDEIGCPGTCVCLDVAHTAVAGGAPPAEWVKGL
jgi:sugar phosphate isomerase/epimerase